MSEIYPIDALRALALHAQRLIPDAPSLSPQALTDTVEALTCVQIDTLYVVERAHYLALWARHGSYDTAALDRLVYREGERRLFEYWGHAASLIPLKDYRYHIPAMQHMRSNPGNWWRKWLKDPDNHRVVDRVLQRVRDEGPLRASDFKYDGPKRDSWWDWKPAKRALEYLFAIGELMIADRENFHRVYDLTERVLPSDVITDPVTHEEMQRYYVENGLRALGVCRPMQTAEYTYMKRGSTRPHIEALIQAGAAIPVRGRLHDGEDADLLVHRDNLPLLQQAAAGVLAAGRTTFLSPFDSLFWARGRDEDFWGFRQVLEAYKPQADRIWGYYCLAILHGDRLVGRFDPKIERDTGLMRLKALYLEPGITPDDALVAGVAVAMRDFMAFHSATDLVVEQSEPQVFGEKLLRAL